MTEHRSHPLIRAAHLDDCSSIVTVHLQCWQQTYQGLLSAQYLNGLEQTRARRIAWFAQTIEAGQPRVLVVEQDGQIVGFCNFGGAREEGAITTDAELMAIYLLATHQRQGLGRALWQQVRQALLPQEFKRVFVWVLEANTEALGFYRSLGFTADSSSSRVFEEQGEPLALICLSLAL